MKAYGRKHGDELEDRHLGAPSKHRKSKHRKVCRRFLHQVARREAKKDIDDQWGK